MLSNTGQQNKLQQPQYEESCQVNTKVLVSNSVLKFFLLRKLSICMKRWGGVIKINNFTRGLTRPITQFKVYPGSQQISMHELGCKHGISDNSPIRQAGRVSRVEKLIISLLLIKMLQFSRYNHIFHGIINHKCKIYSFLMNSWIQIKKK